MDIQDFVKLRNMLNTEVGSLLYCYISDYITKSACQQRDASEIKGMCELWEQIKRIPEKVENYRK